MSLRDEVQYEAQAAMELEMLAEGRLEDGYPFRIRHEARPMVVEIQGIITGVVEDLIKGQPPPSLPPNSIRRWGRPSSRSAAAFGILQVLNR